MLKRLALIYVSFVDFALTIALTFGLFLVFGRISLFNAFIMLLNLFNAPFKRASNDVSLRKVLKGLVKTGLLTVAALAALSLSACSSSLPKGASIPKLEITDVMLSKQNDTPEFIITYSLEHHSATPLAVKEIDADIFLRDTKVAMLKQPQKDVTIDPNLKVERKIVVPANLVGKAGIDSLTNNPLLVLEGQCALQVVFTEDPKLKDFNPTKSYKGLIKVYE